VLLITQAATCTRWLSCSGSGGLLSNSLMNLQHSASTESVHKNKLKNWSWQQGVQPAVCNIWGSASITLQSMPKTHILMLLTRSAALASFIRSRNSAKDRGCVASASCRSSAMSAGVVLPATDALLKLPPSVLRDSIVVVREATSMFKFDRSMIGPWMLQIWMLFNVVHL
jgi:hypothetical protein